MRNFYKTPDKCLPLSYLSTCCTLKIVLNKELKVDEFVKVYYNKNRQKYLQTFKESAKGVLNKDSFLHFRLSFNSPTSALIMNLQCKEIILRINRECDFIWKRFLSVDDKFGYYFMEGNNLLDFSKIANGVLLVPESELTENDTLEVLAVSFRN